MSGPDEIRFVGDLQRLELRPGDRFVLSVPGPISAAFADRLHDAWAKFLGEEAAKRNPVLVLEDGMRLGAVGVGFGAGLDWQPSPAVNDILFERKRQSEVEGWGAAHDDTHVHGELLEAARCYLRHTLGFTDAPVPNGWPWDRSWWKPKDNRRDLVRAGALCLAEQDRLGRLGYGRQAQVQQLFDLIVGKIEAIDACEPEVPDQGEASA